MAVRTQHVTTRSPRYSLGPGADLPIARLVVLFLLVVPLLAFLVIRREVREGPSPEAQQLASVNPRTLLSDNTPHLLPTPVAALPPDQGAGPPAPAAGPPRRSPGGRAARGPGAGRPRAPHHRRFRVAARQDPRYQRRRLGLH